MTNKATKRALLTSVFSLLLCFVMLIGTTFAWFTDTVTSTNNIIKSGNLDVEFKYLDANGSWTTVEGASDILTNDLWEPGATEVAYLEVSNAGSLALKYQLGVNIVNETEGKNVANQSFKLSDYIYFDVIDIDFATNGKFDTRESAVAAVEDAKLISSGETIASAIEANAAAKYYALVVYMPETVGNEANHNGEVVPQISLGLNVVATQLEAETDSFDDQYDVDAEYDAVVTAEDLLTALAAGKNVALVNDIKDAPVTTTAPYGNKYGVAQNGGVFDGNGKVLDFDSPGGDNYGIMTAGGTIKNVTVGGVFRGILVMSPNEDVVIDNVTIDDEDVCYALNTAEGNGQYGVIVKNSTLAGWTSIGNTVKFASFTNCIFKQGTYYTNVYGRLVKPYVNTVFENCDFGSMYYIDLSALGAGHTVTLKNCTVNGVRLTAENWKTLVAPEDTCSAGQISIEGRNGSYMTADNIFDYVTIQ